jgi:hypothetical protein
MGAVNGGRAPEHLAETCQDDYCPRFPCRLWKRAHQAGYDKGRQEGYDEGHAAGYSAGYAAGAASCQ